MAELAAAYFTACEAGTYRPRGRKKAASTLAQERWVWSKYLKNRVGDDAMGSIGVCIAIKLALFTLQRRNEVARMHLTELDFEHKTWVIPEDKMKGRAEHLVKLSDQAIVLIKAALKLHKDGRKGSSQYVFPSPPLQ